MVGRLGVPLLGSRRPDGHHRNALQVHAFPRSAGWQTYRREMRVFLTGGTGFIGSRVAERLRARGDDVVALVRSSARATALVGLGCELIEGDLNDRIDVDRGVEGSDVVVHMAARFEIGVPRAECPKMEDVNVGGVRRVLDSSLGAGVSRVLYVSTVNVFGDTLGQVVDESHERDESRGFFSCYDSSKYRAHKLAQRRIADGAPIVMVQPGVVYGPRDHFEIGREILLAARGQLRMLMLGDVGITMSYVDDVADGIVRALEVGRVGESYVLGGDNVYLRDVLAQSAQLAGKPPPRRTVPTGLLKAISPVGHLVAPRLGYPPNLKEMIEVADGRTYWASHAKAHDELDYSSRPLEEGLRATLTAAGIPLKS